MNKCHYTIFVTLMPVFVYFKIDPPICTGEVHLFEGNSTTLACELEYSGQKPSLQWFRDGEEVESVDEYEIRLAKKVVSVLATASHDQAKYTCSMSLGQHTEDCNLVLYVKCETFRYSVTASALFALLNAWSYNKILYFDILNVSGYRYT